MRRHGATHTSAQLADLLNAAGLTTGKGKPFTVADMASLRHVYKIPGPRTMVYPMGPGHSRVLPAERRRLVPPQTRVAHRIDGAGPAMNRCDAGATGPDIVPDGDWILTAYPRGRSPWQDRRRATSR
jgi:hypothetical protein